MKITYHARESPSNNNQRLTFAPKGLRWTFFEILSTIHYSVEKRIIHSHITTSFSHNFWKNSESKISWFFIIKLGTLSFCLPVRSMFTAGKGVKITKNVKIKIWPLQNIIKNLCLRSLPYAYYCKKGQFLPIMATRVVNRHSVDMYATGKQKVKTPSCTMMIEAVHMRFRTFFSSEIASALTK